MPGSDATLEIVDVPEGLHADVAHYSSAVLPYGGLNMEDVPAEAAAEAAVASADAGSSQAE